MLARKGRLEGRKPKLTTTPQTELRRGQGTGDYTITDLAETVHHFRPAVYRTPQQWKLLLHNATADNASSLFASGSASRVSERRRAIRERGLAVAEEASWCPTSASVTST